jgi:hypothetical protein
MSDLFGGSKSKSTSQQQSTSNSYNQAYPGLANAYGGQISTGTGASAQLGNMLGLNGPQGQNDAFNNWKNSTGYQFGLDQGMQSVTGNAATQGLLNSGSTAKALNTYGQNYANTQYGNYTGQLQNLVNSGLGAGGLVAGAGQVANSQSTGYSKSNASENRGGTGAFLGSLLAK